MMDAAMIFAGGRMVTKMGAYLVEAAVVADCDVKLHVMGATLAEVVVVV